MFFGNISSLEFKLKSENEDKRAKAAEKLGKTKSKKAIKPLLDALEKEYSSYVRREIIIALTSIDNATTLPNLSARLERGTWGTWQALAEPLQSMGWQPDSDVQHARLLIGLHDWEKLKTLGNEIIEPLLSTLREEPPKALYVNGVRSRDIPYMAEQTLQQLGDIAVEPLLVALKNETSQWARLAIIRILAEIGDDRAIQPLIQLNGDADYSIRFLALESLGKFQSSRATEFLIEALTHEVVDFRLTVVQKLRESGDARAIPALVSALDDPNFTVVSSALDALRSLGWQPQNEKQFAISVIVSGDMEKINDISLVDVQATLYSALESSYSGWEIAVEGLVRLGDPSAVESLLSAAEDDGASIAKTEAATKALGRIADQKAFTRLLRLTNYKSIAPTVIESLMEIIKKNGHKLTEEELNAAAQLSNVVENRFSLSDKGEMERISVEVDCAELNRLALEELKHRELAP